MARHLTMEERDRIAQLKQQGASQTEIAQALRRSPSTICRELQRNGTGNEYLAAQAQHRATSRRRERPLARRMDDPEIKAAVCRGLSQFWSPEQIAGRLQLETAGRQQTVCARTIYNWISRHKARHRWRSFLRRRGKRGDRPRRPSKIGAPIRERPEIIEARARLGDFEGGEFGHFRSADQRTVTSTETQSIVPGGIAEGINVKGYLTWDAHFLRDD